MTVRDIVTTVRAKGTALGIKKELLSEPFLIELIDEAMIDFTGKTKANLKQVFTNTIAEQEYYRLPLDFMTPKHVELDGKPLAGLNILDYLLYKRGY